MNQFLKSLEVTFRRDPVNFRPRYVPFLICSLKRLLEWRIFIVDALRHFRFFIASERCLGVGTGIFNVFVLISYQRYAENNGIITCFRPPVLWFSRFYSFLVHIRINKHGSQKDQEQKKNGNYFFYDADDDDDADDFDDI